MTQTAAAHTPEYWVLRASAGSLPADYYSVALISEFSEKSFLLTEPNMIVGRDPAVSQILLPGARVSRQHAQLQVFQEGLFIRDLGSSNGTFVNGKRVSEAFVASGDVIAFDHVTLTVWAPKDALESGINKRTLKALRPSPSRHRKSISDSAMKQSGFWDLVKRDTTLFATALFFFFLGLSLAFIIG